MCNKCSFAPRWMCRLCNYQPDDLTRLCDFDNRLCRRIHSTKNDDDYDGDYQYEREKLEQAIENAKKGIFFYVMEEGIKQ